MRGKVTEKIKRDPSEIKQVFNEVTIKLQCCRYWILEEWECKDLSVPFWRIYYNNIPGAQICFNNIITELDKNKIVIIPPNTRFSTKLKEGKLNFESISGRKFRKGDNLYTISKENKVDHLFIHFSLGFPLDYVKTGINVIPCNDFTDQIISSIQHSCMDDTVFNFSECLTIKQLISFSILQLQDNIWKFGNIDSRVFNSMYHIESHYKEKITNEELAEKANMAVNSFARLFKTTTGISVQQHILKTRIEKSCDLMHHSNKTIDEIAFECGFSDRHHFSKIFKKVLNITPAYYKKHLTII
jgi:AraC-like DNA-binding protein